MYVFQQFQQDQKYFRFKNGSYMNESPLLTFDRTVDDVQQLCKSQIQS
jgi:hypothetical protein